MALQILTMTTSIMFNTPLKEDWNGRFKAMWAKMWGTILFIFKYLQVSFLLKFRHLHYPGFWCALLLFGGADQKPLQARTKYRFWKLSGGGGQSHPKILDNQTSNKKKKVRKKKRTSSQIMGWARKPTITSILMLISCFSFHFFTCSKKVGGRATPW